jgi:hypothetical protein
MAAVSPYPVGTKVRIRKFRRIPDGWNQEMFDYMMGEIAIIRNAPPPGARISTAAYNYKLVNSQWSWRHADFDVLEMPKLEPNSAFRIKKHGI